MRIPSRAGTVGDDMRLDLMNRGYEIATWEESRRLTTNADV